MGISQQGEMNVGGDEGDPRERIYHDDLLVTIATNELGDVPGSSPPQTGPWNLIRRGPWHHRLYGSSRSQIAYNDNKIASLHSPVAVVPELNLGSGGIAACNRHGNRPGHSGTE